MAINFFNQVDLNQNQLKQAAINNVTNDPTTGVLGELIYNTSDGSLKVCTTAYNPATNPVTDAVYTAVGAGVDSISAGAGEFVTFTNADFVDETGDVDFGSFDLSATATSGSIDNTKYLRGDNKWATLPSSDNYNYWTFGSDSMGGTANIDSQERINFEGGTVMNTVGTTINGSPYTLTINHDDLTVTQTAGSDLAPGYGGKVDIVTSVTTTDQGHVDTVTTQEIEWPAAEDYDFKVDGDTSGTTPQTIGNGETLQFNGSTADSANAGISITAKATDILEFKLDASLIKDESSVDDPTQDYLMVFQDGTDNVKVFIDDIHINEFGDAEGVVNMGDGTSNFQIKNLADPTDLQDAVTKNYADGLLSSALQFKGTFKASTGAIAGTSPAEYLYQLDAQGNFDANADRVAVAVGDLYIADVSGDFYANSATPLTVGDQVFGQTAAAANTSVESDWAVVQSDTDESTYAAIGIGNVNANTSTSVTGYTGGNGGPSQSGTGILDVAYSTGTANLSIRNASASLTGVGRVTNADGSVAVSYAADGTATLSVSGNSNGFKVTLNDTDPSSRNHAGGITTYSVDVSDSSLYGGSQAAIDIKAEVITTAGQTVYADITRNASNLNIAFVDPGNIISNTAYQVLIVRV